MGCSPPGSSIHENSSDKKTGVGFHFLLQGIFLTQVSWPTWILPRGPFTTMPPGKPMYTYIHTYVYIHTHTHTYIYIIYTYIHTVASIVSDSLWHYDCTCQAPLSWDSPGKNIGVSCHALLWGIFPTQGSNPSLLHLLHWRWILFHWATGEAHIEREEERENYFKN